MLRRIDKCGATFGCAPEALSALLDKPSTDVLAMLREIEPLTCVSPRGTRLNDVERLLSRFYQIEAVHFTRPVPLHLALKMLRGRKAYLSVRIGRNYHGVAAEGFMVADNSLPTAVWWADWNWFHRAARATSRWTFRQRTYVPRPVAVYSVLILPERA